MSKSSWTPPGTDGSLVGVESKFTEWLTPKPPSKEPFKPKYFPQDRALWTDRGLPSCQQAAHAMARQELSFNYPEAAQLLKHALGLASAEQPFELCYLYYEAATPEAAIHRRESQEFSTAIRG